MGKLCEIFRNLIVLQSQSVNSVCQNAPAFPLDPTVGLTYPDPSGL